MKLHKITLIFLMLLLAMAIASARETVLSKGNELRIDLLKYDPSPIEPGAASDIWFEITNLGDEDLSNFEITLVDGSAKLMSIDTKTLNFGRLKSGEKITFRFAVTPNKEIPDGDYQLNLQYSSKRLDKITSEPFTIKTQRINRDVSATSIKVETTSKIDIGMLIPGKTSELTLTVHNPTDYTMKDITVSIDLSSTTLPIAPLGTTSETKIAAISPRQSADVRFSIIALPDATSGVYKIPLKIEYYDETGNNHTKDDLIGLVIDGEPELHIELKSNEIYSNWGTGEITINIVNKGLSKIKFLTVKLEGPKEIFKILGKEYPTYKILSESKVYLGDIDPDDDESADYLLKAKAPAGEITLPLTLEYRDANNEPHTETRELKVEIHSKKTLGLEESSYLWKIIVLFILIFFFLRYRKWKKQSSKKGLLEYIRYLKSKLSREK